MIRPLVLLTILGSGLTIHGSTLPLPTYFVSVVQFGNGDCTINSPGSCSQGSGTASLAPAPALLLHAQTSGVDSAGSVALARVTYNFAVSGGTPGDLVHLLINFSLAVSESSSDPLSTVNASANMTVNSIENITHTWSSSVEVCAKNSGSCFGETAAQAFQLPALAWSGQNGTVSLQVQTTLLGSGSASAFADPNISIDPSYPNAGIYTLDLSPGIGNQLAADSASVPEPGSLILLGCGGLLAVVWRRRQKLA